METQNDPNMKLTYFFLFIFLSHSILLNVFLIAKVGHSSGSLLAAVVNLWCPDWVPLSTLR